MRRPRRRRHVELSQQLGHICRVRVRLEQPPGRRTEAVIAGPQNLPHPAAVRMLCYSVSASNSNYSNLRVVDHPRTIPYSDATHLDRAAR